MKLVPISESGELPDGIVTDDYLNAVLEMTRKHFENVGFVPPWNGYIAVEEAGPVGTCAFKSPPRDGRVEIAYVTIPCHEGRGVATRMARELIRIARDQDPGLVITAQTLPEQNASTAILEKLGFLLIGSVEHPEDGTVWEWELR